MPYPIPRTSVYGGQVNGLSESWSQGVLHAGTGPGCNHLRRCPSFLWKQIWVRRWERNQWDTHWNFKVLGTLYMRTLYTSIKPLIYFYQEKKKKIRKSCRTVLCNTRSQVSILQLDLKQLRHTTVLLLQLCPVTAKDPYFSAPRGLDPKGTVPIHNCSVSLQVLSACPELHL